MKFLLQSLVSRRFPVRPRFSGYFFFLSSLFVWWYPLPISPSTCNFPYLQVFWFFLDLAVLFLPLFIFYQFSLIPLLLSLLLLSLLLLLVVVVVVVFAIFLSFFLYPYLFYISFLSNIQFYFFAFNTTFPTP